MRIWSIHPSYLDAKGLVALWRETLLAKNVLEGNTKGYRSHPQLHRFKETPFPVNSINYYLQEIFNEACCREYNFNRSKINWELKADKIPVTNKQIEFEFEHLLKKLQIRDASRYNDFQAIKNIKPHPLFEIIEGEIEAWEIVDK